MEGKEGEKIIERVEEFYKELFSKDEVDKETRQQVLEKMEAKLSEEAKQMCEEV